MATYLTPIGGAFDFVGAAILNAAAYAATADAGLGSLASSTTATFAPGTSSISTPMFYIPSCSSSSAAAAAASLMAQLTTHHSTGASAVNNICTVSGTLGNAQLKRGPDELGLFNSGIGSPMDSGIEITETKKVRLDIIPEPSPSKVVHIRNLPADATEAEITALGTPFGGMSNMVLAKKKNQALLEFRREDMAVKMVNYYKHVTANLRGRNIIIQFSNYQELKTEQQNSAADNALKTANITADAPKECSSVLKVIVNQVVYPVTVEILHQIFERYGVVEKIITFTRNGQFHALIQMSNSVEAQNAKLYLDCQNIYTGCNTLRIDFSKNTSLNVKYNNEKSRDYTLSNGNYCAENALSPFHQLQSNLTPTTLGTSMVNPSDLSTLSDHQQRNLCARLALAASESPLPSLKDHYSNAMSLPPSFLPHGIIDGSGNLNMLSLSAFASGLNQSGPSLPYGMNVNGFVLPQTSTFAFLNNVLLVSNLNDEKVTPDALFTLFGVYGDVQRVKIIFAKKDNALVQFADGQQAQQALQHLNGVKLFDKPMKIVFSKHNQVQLPKEGIDAGLTKDYSNSALHRFKKPNSKNFQNIFSPSAVLHLSNIPSDYSDSSLRKIFEEMGYTVVAFKFFQKDKKMALIQLTSVEEAIHALIQMHNRQLSENFHLRVSFSKSII